MPKRWEYSGDVNMLDYGGTFSRRLPGTSRFHFVELTNMDEACGRDNEGRPPYVVELTEVDLAVLTPAQVKSALGCCGRDLADVEEAKRDAWLAEAVHGYGIRAPLHSASGTNGHALLCEAKAESRRLEADEDAYAERMSRPVNRLGSTAAEFQRGDLTSAMLRGVAAGDPSASLVSRMSAPGLSRAGEGVRVTVALRKVPSPDPIAYFAGFIDSLHAQPLPRERSKERRALAAAHINGHAHGTRVRHQIDPIPDWIK